MILLYKEVLKQGKDHFEKTIEINGAQISAQNFIIATGSRPKSLSNINSNSDKIAYSKDIFSMDTLPASITIVGAGAIGAEFAYFFSSFGTEVTLIEAEDRILPNEDKEISTWLEKAFKKRKINILTSTIAENIDDEKIYVTIEDGIQSDCQNTKNITCAELCRDNLTWID